MDYEEPEWSSKPICDYSLQVIKEGIITSEISLSSSPYFAFSKDFCEPTLSDPQIPDFTLIFQHSDQGYLFLFSPKQTQEVLLNKEKIQGQTYIRLYPNDFFEFSQSQTIVTILGPGHMQRTEKMFSKTGKFNTKVLEKLHQVSWGFGEDAVNQKINKEDEVLFEENLNLALLKSRKNITEKQKKIIAKLENYEEKIERLQSTLTKITRSQNSDSEKLKKLSEKLENLIGEKELTEENLRSSFIPDYYTKKVIPKGAYDFSSDEDEYYDRAKPSNSSGFSQNTQEELNELFTQREAISEEITSLSAFIDQDFDDPLDAYMMGNSLNLREENLKVLGSRLKNVLEKIQSIEKQFPNIKGSVIIKTNINEMPEVRIGNKKRKIEKNEGLGEPVFFHEDSPEITSKVKNASDQELEENSFSDWMPPSGQNGDG